MMKMFLVAMMTYEELVVTMNALANGDPWTWTMLVVVVLLTGRSMLKWFHRRQQTRKELSLSTAAKLLGAGAVIRAPHPYAIKSRVYRSADAILLQSKRAIFPYTSEFFHGTPENFDPMMIVLPSRRISHVESSFSIMALGSIVKVTMDNGESFKVKASSGVRHGLSAAKT